MITHAYLDRYTSREIQIHEGTNVFLTRLDIGTPAVRSVQANEPTRHGSVDVTSFFAPRTITLGGEVFASSGSALWSAVDQLKAAVSIEQPHALTIRRDGLLYDETISFRASGPLTVPLTSGAAHYIRWGFTMVCPDPRFYGEATSSSGLDLNTAHTLTNAGNISTPITIVLNGPCNSGAEIENTTLGKKITLAKSLGSSDAITITTSDRNVIGPSGSTDMSYIDSGDTEWWDLPAGASTVEITASGTSGSSEFLAVFSDARI